MQVNAHVKGPEPQTRLLVVIKSLKCFDSNKGVDIGVPREVQFGYADTPLACNVTNVERSDRLLPKGTPVATTYSVNNYGLLRIQSLLAPHAATADTRQILTAG